MSPEDYSEPERRYDPYQPPGRYDQQPDYGPPSGYDPQSRYQYEDEPPRGSSSGRLIAIFAGLAIVALLVGIGAAKLFGGGNSTPSAAALPSTGATTASALITGEPSPSDQPSPSTTSAKPTPTAPPNYKPIPANAASLKGLDFGFLKKVTSSGGRVTITFDRAYFYTGAEATKRNHGVPPDDDYLIENSNPEVRSFTLDPKASVVAVDRLATTPGSGSSERLTLAQFVTNSKTALADSTSPVPVWLRHTNGLTGQVTALAEQYLP